MDRPKLIAVDLDGTLLPESKRLTERSRRVLAALAARGTVVVLATGKFLHLASRYAEELRLDTPVIALDGARIGINGSPPRQRCIPFDTARALVDRYDDGGWEAFADDGADEMLVRAHDDELARLLSPWAERIRPVSELRGNLVGDPAIVSFYGPGDAIDEVARDAETLYPHLRLFRYSVEGMNRTRLSFQPAGVNKGSGLRAVIDELELAPRDCMVFGDWHNDLHMFELGCVNIAMADAVEELKEAATHVLDLTSEEDAVPRFLESHFL